MSAPMKIFRCFNKSLIKSSNRKEKLNFLRCVQKCHASSTSQIQESPKTWQLYSAVCLQRHPVITPELTPLQEQYEAHLNTQDDVNSLLSNYELLQRDEKERKLKKESAKDEKGTVTEKFMSLADEEDKWQEVYDTFVKGSRITEADTNNDMTSSNRLLDRNLYLIVNKNVANKSVWTLPLVNHEEGESMRQTAERALGKTCGESIDATFMGNAPSGYYKFKLPTGSEDYGVKVFFFKAAYNKGNIKLDMENDTEHKWVTYEQLDDYMNPNYSDELQATLIDDRLQDYETKSC